MVKTESSTRTSRSAMTTTTVAATAATIRDLVMRNITAHQKEPDAPDICGWDVTFPRNIQGKTVSSATS